ncbi:HGGxSTG domain-containing protein [Waddlia chondrophila]|nr:HGGxSTG domain-containing protein [Waddlia chondrophila]
MPRCGAYARSSGKPCLQAAMSNGRCYLHGGKSTTKHGRYTKRSVESRQKQRQAIKELRESQKAMENTING